MAKIWPPSGFYSILVGFGVPQQLYRCIARFRLSLLQPTNLHASTNRKNMFAML